MISKLSGNMIFSEYDRKYTSLSAKHSKMKQYLSELQKLLSSILTAEKDYKDRMDKVKQIIFIEED